jgi:hypothetical protein
MTQQHHDRDARQGTPLTAVYRQLDDHPAAEAAGYDPAATAARLIRFWADDHIPGPKQSQTEDSPGTVDSVRQELILRLGRRRLASMISAYAAILGISGIAAAVAMRVPHLSAAALAGLAATTVLVTHAVVLIHRATMHGMTADHEHQLPVGDAAVRNPAESPSIRQGQHQLAPRPAPLTAAAAAEDEDEDEDDEDLPEIRPTSRGRRLRLTAFLGTEVAGVIAVIVVIGLHAGTVGFIALASTAAAAVLGLLTLVATALFSNEAVSRRAFRLINTLLVDRTTERYHRARPR